MKQKMIKLKVGEVFINNKAVPVFKTFFQKTSKQGKNFYEAREVMFVQEYEKKEPAVRTEKVDA